MLDLLDPWWVLDLTKRSGCLSPAVGEAQSPKEAMCHAVPLLLPLLQLH